MRLQHDRAEEFVKMFLAENILLRNECLTQKRRVHWDLLEARTLGPVLEGSETVSYDKLVVRFGLRSPSEVSNLLVTAKRMFVRLLQDVEAGCL